MTKEQSKEWTKKGELAPKKTIPLAGKVMASVFWDARVIIFISCLDKGKTINGKYYTNLLQRLSEKIMQEHLHFTKVSLRQDNTPVHKSINTLVKINELHFELLPQAPYSPDLTPTNYFLFPNMKNVSLVKDFH